MAHPKRRTSKSAKNLRRSHLALNLTKAQHCPRCGTATKSHCVCENCGHYGFDKGGAGGEAIVEKEEF